MGSHSRLPPSPRFRLWSRGGNLHRPTTCPQSEARRLYSWGETSVLAQVARWRLSRPRNRRQMVSWRVTWTKSRAMIGRLQEGSILPIPTHFFAGATQIRALRLRDPRREVLRLGPARGNSLSDGAWIWAAPCFQNRRRRPDEMAERGRGAIWAETSRHPELRAPQNCRH